MIALIVWKCRGMWDEYAIVTHEDRSLFVWKYAEVYIARDTQSELEIIHTSLEYVLNARASQIRSATSLTARVHACKQNIS